MGVIRALGRDVGRRDYMAAADGASTNDNSSARWSYGIVAVALGIIAIVASLWIVVDNFTKAADVGSVLGIVVAPIGTIVGAYFGVQAGAAGKDKADANAKDANNKAIALAAGLDP